MNYAPPDKNIRRRVFLLLFLMGCARLCAAYEMAI